MKFLNLLLLFTISTLLAACYSSKKLSARKKQYVTNLSETNFGKRILQSDFSRDGIIVSIKIVSPVNKQADFFFDTGASTMLSRKFCDDNHISYYPDSNSKNISTGSKDYRNTEIKQFIAHNIVFDIEGLKVAKPDVAVIDMKGMNDITCKQVSGIIGIDFMLQFGVFIDFSQKLIVLYDQNTQPDMMHNYDYRILYVPSLYQRIPFVNLQVDKVRYHFVWDLGYAGDLFIQFGKKNKPEFDKWMATFPGVKTFATKNIFGDINGMEKSDGYIYFIKTDSVKNYFTPLSCKSTEIIYRYNPDLKNYSNTIGTGFIKHYSMFSDWKHRTIYLKKDDSFIISDTLSYEYNSISIDYDFSNKNLKISSIDTSSAGYKSGGRPGDIVIKAGDADCSKINAVINKCNKDTILENLFKGSKTIEIQNVKNQKPICVEIH